MAASAPSRVTTSSAARRIRSTFRCASALSLRCRRGAEAGIGDYLADHSALGVPPEPSDYVSGYLLLASKQDSRITTGAVLDISSVGTPKRPTVGG